MLPRMQHDIGLRSGQHEDGADKSGKGDNGAEGLGESLEEQNHRHRNKEEGVTDYVSSVLY